MPNEFECSFRASASRIHEFECSFRASASRIHGPDGWHLTARAAPVEQGDLFKCYYRPSSSFKSYSITELVAHTSNCELQAEFTRKFELDSNLLQCVAGRRRSGGRRIVTVGPKAMRAHHWQITCQNFDALQRGQWQGGRCISDDSDCAYFDSKLNAGPGCTMIRIRLNSDPGPTPGTFRRGAVTVAGTTYPA